MLLPLLHNDGRPVSPAKHRQTREELFVRFGAVSSLPGTVHGAWLHAGIRYEDESLRLLMDVANTKENRKFFVEFKAGLLERFEQIEIYIVSHMIDIV
jgi:hypothetical protein